MAESRSIEHRGCRLFYDVTGDGPPVLFIQGVGVHGAGWAPQVEALSRRFRCIAFDNRGVGRSVPPGGPITVEGMAADAAAVMEAEGWRSAHLVGHSLGGLVALALALNEPSRAASLSLLCTFARGADATRLTARMAWLGLRSRVGSKAMRRRAFLEIVAAPGEVRTGERDLLADRLAPLFGHDLADHPPAEMKQLSAMGRYDATPRLGELSGVPTLVLSAANDPIARPASGRSIAGGIPGAKYVELPDASHGVPLLRPDVVNTVLLEHIDAAEAALRLAVR
jgi:pimeloyl-ACP methyl ester carboxylesterase